MKEIKKANDETGRRWAIVLAGGEGTRMRDWVESVYGEPRPKQYCAFTGGKTMLEHTYERAGALVPEERIVTVIGRGHWRYLDEPRRIHLPGRVIEQPENKETAPGILLPLRHILKQDPDAVVSILPSDHFILPARRFTAHLRGACELAEHFDDRIVILGAEAERPETDYGWIKPKNYLISGSHPCTRDVAGFMEKPNRPLAREYYQEGCYWNTMIMACRARALWKLAADLHPGVAEVIDSAVGPDGEIVPDALARAYRLLPKLNFSYGVLERRSDKVVLQPMRGVVWCDWGRPERVEKMLDVLEQIENVRPRFTPTGPVRGFAAI